MFPSIAWGQLQHRGQRLTQLSACGTSDPPYVTKAVISSWPYKKKSAEEASNQSACVSVCLHTCVSLYLCVCICSNLNGTGGGPGSQVYFLHIQLTRWHTVVRLLWTIPKHIRNDDKTRRPHTEMLLRHTACWAQTQRLGQAQRGSGGGTARMFYYSLTLDKWAYLDVLKMSLSSGISCPQCPSNSLPDTDYNIVTNAASSRGFVSSNIRCHKHKKLSSFMKTESF